MFGMMFTSLAQGAEKLFVMTSEAIARIASVTVESTMNLTYQTVMRSCYKPGKILSDARWERKSPGRIRKGKLFERGTKCREEKDMINGGLKIGPNYFYPLSLLYVSRFYSSAVITFNGFPEHWMIFTRLIRRSNDSLLDSTTTHSLHSFRYASTTLWNRLPEDLRSTTFLIGSLNSKCDKFRLNKYSNTRNG